MAYTDLITVSELSQAALNSLDLSGMEPAAGAAITDVTRQIENYLSRKLIVRKVKQGVPDDDWRTDPVTDDKVWTWASEWPVVEAVTSDLEVHAYDERKLQLGDSDSGSYEYFAGYRRRDQELADLQKEISSISTLPEILPGDIRRVAIELTLYTLHQGRDGTYGRGSVMQEVGTQTVTVERADTRFVARTLSKLDRHRKLI